MWASERGVSGHRGGSKGMIAAPMLWGRICQSKDFILFLQKPPCKCRELSMSPLQEQPGLLTTEPSPLPETGYIVILLNKISYETLFLDVVGVRSIVVRWIIKDGLWWPYQQDQDCCSLGRIIALAVWIPSHKTISTLSVLAVFAFFFSLAILCVH